jgi:membrane protease YdiL (CAAX protease family)
MSTSKATRNFEQEGTTQKVPQYNLWMILFMFAWPAAWFSFLIYVIAPLFLAPDGTLPTWGENLVWLLGNSAEMAVALIILRREGYRLTPRALRERINWRFPDKLWKWGAVVGVFIAAVAVTMLLAPTQQTIATLLPPPDWMPGHPLKEITGLQDAYPDVNFAGNVLFFLYRAVVLGFVMNMVGEELYYRGALQPKMRGVFGRWDWVANSIGFTLKHVYFWWRLPFLWPGGLAYAFIFGPMGSLPLSILFHWIGNLEPVTAIQILSAVLGGG